LIVSALTRLKTPQDFSSVFNFKSRFHGRLINIYFKPNNLNFNRYGFIVSKKINKKAVDRNYMKRTLREIIRLTNFKNYFDVVFQVKKNFSSRQFNQVKVEINTFVNENLN
jgi:ribonuclease P protein component